MFNDINETNRNVIRKGISMIYELLVVDDEVNSRNTLATCFPWYELGFHICGQAGNGREAMDFIAENIVHVVLSDIRMPVMDGIELSKLIHEQKSKKIIMVLLSAYNDFSYAQQAIKYGVKEYLLKPSNFSELKEIFEKIRMELDVLYDTTAVPSGKEGDIIAQVYQYCAENYKEGSLVELADRLFLNSSYLSQLIRQKTDKTFSDIMNENRMQQAVILLENSDIKIYTIGHMIGYMNPNNFTRAFRNHFGIAPTEYRLSKGK